MPKFAPVAPAQIVRQLLPYSSGDYHLILAHDVIKHPTEYNSVYDQHNFTVILDNSVVELGSAVDVKIIHDAAVTTNANIIALPDVYKDGPATTRSIYNALPKWRATFEDHFAQRARSGWMIIPHGATLKDFATCAECLNDIDGAIMWGVPRVLVEQIGTRRDAVKICHMLNPERPIHLLGFSDDLIDDMLCAHLPRVSGIDSAVPLRAASLGRQMSLTIDMPPRGDWWETATYDSLMDENIGTVQRWLKRNGL
jgi:queuine/archaeosine tRNA-ribosyltransferase